MYTFKSCVRYSEINSEGELTLPSLLDYLQDCCTFQSEDLGIGIQYLAENHVAWVLSSWQIKIFRYPKLGEEICVNTWPYNFKGFYGFRNFSVTDSKGETLAAANSLWVFMDTERMRPARILEHVKDIYEKELEEALPGPWEDRKILVPECGTPKEAVLAARFHIDTNHHVNNGKYILMAEEYLPEDFSVGGLRTEFKKSAVLGDIMYPEVTENADDITVVWSDGEKNPYAVIQFLRK